MPSVGQILVDLDRRLRFRDYPKYQAIGVPELWIYRHFDGQQYQACQTSQHPDMDIKTLIHKYVDRSWQVSSSVALREFEDFLRS